MMPAARIAQPHTRRAHGLSPRCRRRRRRSRNPSSSMWIATLCLRSLNMTLPFLGIATARGVDNRPHDDSAAEDDQQQRPGRGVREAVDVQRHHLQPRAEGDDPESRPDRLAAKNVRRADEDDDQRPVVAHRPRDVQDVQLAEQQNRAGREEKESPENLIALVVLLAHTASAAMLLMSTPAIITNPLTTSFRPPGAALVRTSAPPMTGRMLSVTSQPSGTLISMPPHIAAISNVAGTLSISALVRSSSHPPMNAMMRPPR